MSKRRASSYLGLTVAAFALLVALPARAGLDLPSQVLTMESVRASLRAMISTKLVEMRESFLLESDAREVRFTTKPDNVTKVLSSVAYKISPSPQGVKFGFDDQTEIREGANGAILLGEYRTVQGKNIQTPPPSLAVFFDSSDGFAWELGPNEDQKSVRWVSGQSEILSVKWYREGGVVQTLVQVLGNEVLSLRDSLEGEVRSYLIQSKSTNFQMGLLDQPFKVGTQGGTYQVKVRQHPMTLTPTVEFYNGNAAVMGPKQFQKLTDVAIFTPLVSEGIQKYLKALTDGNRFPDTSSGGGSSVSSRLADEIFLMKRDINAGGASIKEVLKRLDEWEIAVKSRLIIDQRPAPANGR